MARPKKVIKKTIKKKIMTDTPTPPSGDEAALSQLNTPAEPVTPTPDAAPTDAPVTPEATPATDTAPAPVAPDAAPETPAAPVTPEAPAPTPTPATEPATAPVTQPVPTPTGNTIVSVTTLVRYYFRGTGEMKTREFKDAATAQEFITNPNNQWIDDGAVQQPKVVTPDQVS